MCSRRQVSDPMQPDLLKLKPLKNLKEVHETYLKFFQKYKSDKYWKYVPCPICKKDDSTWYLPLTIDNFRYSTCMNCLCFYNHRQLTVPIDYKLYQNKLVRPGKKMRKKFAQIKYVQIAKYIKGHKGFILDVGCGMGELLDVFNKKGWITYGVEPSMRNRPYIMKCSFEEFQSDIRFDCITFFGVLEHVNNPIELLKKAKSMLARDGIIVFEVPSSDSFLMKYIEKYPFSPYRFIEHARHLSFFSRETIDYICKEIKMEVMEIKTIGFDLQTILLESNKRILRMQDILNENLLADHYRVYVR